jgi:general secretion pathway protein A
MYEQHFRMTGKPFSLLPEANAVFFSDRHQHILNLLEYGIENQMAFIVITGDVGAGKTTVLRYFLNHLPPDLTVGLITNPSRRLGSLLSWVSNAFELDNFGNDEAKMYNGFVEFLLARYAKGKRTVLIIDEAQNLAPDVLEELRMLSNVNNEQDMLLQIVLAGQPELLDTLNRTDLRQFVQRIGVHGHLTALTPSETANYIRHRLSVAGASEGIFDGHACAAVHLFTGGVPRLVNLLCDQALIYSYAEGQLTVNVSVVIEAVRDRSKTGLSIFRHVVENESEESLSTKIEDVYGQIANKI